MCIKKSSRKWSEIISQQLLRSTYVPGIILDSVMDKRKSL